MESGKTAEHELAVLYPAPRTVTIAGRAIEIKRCGISQAGRIIDTGAPLYQRVQDGADFPTMFEEFPDETSALVVAGTGLPLDWVRGLDPIDRFDLASAWMEVNAGFFVRRLLPSMARYWTAKGAMLGIGPISSDTSSITGTSTQATILQPPLNDLLMPSPAPKGEIELSA